MTTRPEIWTLDRVAALPPGESAVWATASVADRVRERLPFAAWAPGQAIPANLIVAGGGTMMDEAKRMVHDEAPDSCLIAIPTVWGSGAEASPVVVLNREGRKEIRLDDAFLPHVRVVWGELASTISPSRAREACGDAWAHALEGFLSPLATDELRRELAGILRSMIAVGVGNDPRWFELSARAAAAQARSSVGLIHGIAHTLEAAVGFGHARLCAAYARPVFAFDRRAEKVLALLSEHELDADEIARQNDRLFDAADYRATLPELERMWPAVLRDRCTRTNAALVRPADLRFFLDFS